MSNIIKLPAFQSEIEITPDWITARDNLVADAATIKTITDAESFKLGGEILRKLTKTSNAMEAFRKQYGEPHAEAVKTIKAAADAARDPLEKAKARIQAQLNNYAAEQQRQAEAERKRIEAEQRAAVERQLAEQEKAAAEAEELGLTAPEPVEPTAPEPALPVIAAPKAEAVRVQTDAAWQLVDEEKVDRAFMSIDTKKVNEYMRANKDRIIETLKENPEAVILSGIKVEVKTKVISR